MKKRISSAFLKGLILVPVIALLSAMASDRFQEVIDSANNPKIRNSLIAFRKGGIERPVNTRDYNVEKVIAFAESFLNTPHKMGGTTDKGIDCSGLVMVVHAKFKILLPHSSHEQARFGMVIPKTGTLERGDLVFFYNSYTSRNFITHSGIYLGEGNFIHTSTTKGVIISKIDDVYWGEKYLFATRFGN